MSEEIENLLRAMPLKKPSAALDARVLGRSARRWWWLAPVAGGALAAAAALVLAVALPHGGQPPAAPPAPVAPAEATAQAAGPERLEQNWSEVSYEGLVTPDEGTPLRKFRRRTYEYVRWFDPRQGIQVETTVPREEVILVKAAVQ